MHLKTARLAFAALGVAALMLTTVAAPAGAKVTKVVPSGAQYLSLGDSLGFGFQERILDKQFDTGVFDPTAFHKGYTDQLAKKLKSLRKDTAVTNFSCPGETTDSMRDACEYPFGLHNDFTGSQLDAALDFIAAHPGDVGTITISLGANDLLNFIDSCDDQACIDKGLPKALTHIKTQLGFIMRKLRKAAPGAVIIMLKYYDPLAVVDPTADANLLKLDDVIGKVAAASNVKAKTADAFPTFNLAKHEPQTLCRLTLMCSDGDIHAGNAGYQVIGNLMYAASGYGVQKP